MARKREGEGEGEKEEKTVCVVSFGFEWQSAHLQPLALARRRAALRIP